VYESAIYSKLLSGYSLPADSQLFDIDIILRVSEILEVGRSESQH
jgi:hypothetical protein